MITQLGAEKLQSEIIGELLLSEPFKLLLTFHLFGKHFHNFIAKKEKKQKAKSPEHCLFYLSIKVNVIQTAHNQVFLSHTA